MSCGPGDIMQLISFMVQAHAGQARRCLCLSPRIRACSTIVEGC